jgi:hypothetical protein
LDNSLEVYTSIVEVGRKKTSNETWPTHGIFIAQIPVSSVTPSLHEALLLDSVHPLIWYEVTNIDLQSLEFGFCFAPPISKDVYTTNNLLGQIQYTCSKGNSYVSHPKVIICSAKAFQNGFVRHPLFLSL